MKKLLIELTAVAVILAILVIYDIWRHNRKTSHKAFEYKNPEKRSKYD